VAAKVVAAPAPAVTAAAPVAVIVDAAASTAGTGAGVGLLSAFSDSSKRCQNSPVQVVWVEEADHGHEHDADEDLAAQSAHRTHGSFRLGQELFHDVVGHKTAVAPFGHRGPCASLVYTHASAAASAAGAVAVLINPPTRAAAVVAIVVFIHRGSCCCQRIIIVLQF